MRPSRLGSWLALPVLCWAAAARFTTAELDSHKAWMDDAQGKQEDVREALAAKDRTKLVGAAIEIEKLAGKEQEFWVRAAIQPAQDLAAKNRAEAREMLKSAQAGRFAEAGQALASLEKTCSSCHDLHFEKQLNAK